MVSDPKLYRPTINPSTNTNVEEEEEGGSEPDIGEFRATLERRGSWVSWPLGFVFNGVFDDRIPLRFRNWETSLAITNGHQRGSSRLGKEDSMKQTKFTKRP
ncbi:uncharacterized protein LOC136039616 [Artemia franciscana]